MKLDYKNTSLAAVAIIAGMIILSGYFIRLDALLELRDTLLNWAIILAGVALLVGVINLARVHWGRIVKRKSGWGNSWVMLFSLLITMGVAVYFGPTANPSMWVYNHIQIPLETSMLALLTIVLVIAVTRLFARKMNSYTLLFIGTVIIVILGTISLPGVELTVLQEVRMWVTQTWAGAGARGILFGVALGTLAAGIRVLMGVDRPYSG